jgi:hypothetical protein
LGFGGSRGFGAIGLKIQEWVQFCVFKFVLKASKSPKIKELTPEHALPI